MSKFSKAIVEDGQGGPFKSFNSDYHLVREDTKVIIVGTITSPQGRGANKDFYYMSPYNPMYRIIDAFFKDTSFVKNKKIGDVPAIIEELKEKKIAFLDVVESCSNPKNSSLDDDLEDIKLDYEAFKGIDENIVMLANSKNAYNALLKIAEKNHLKNKIEYVYGFRFYKQEDWNNAFKKYL
ncbi:MAG: hypothetical protein J6T25_03480 [Bacilli bacterium]|nr:hypothetical protein [Bacilli bacterium]